MKEYIIGIDIGTTSNGWAVVDSSNYKVIRKGNKKLWGVRLFDEAITAEDRRNFRNSRKKYDRRRERIRLLQEEFKEEIFKVDKNFFIKLKESFYQENDINNKTIKLTKEEKESIIKYNKQYPTIYHLRNELINNKEKKDIRLVYLAIHHIIKYRGNFLYTTDSFNAKTLNINEKIKNIFSNLYHLSEEILFNNMDEQFYCDLENAITDVSKANKKIMTKNVLEGYCTNNFINEFIKLISGNQFSISKLLNIELEEDIKISFKGNDYEEKYSVLEKNLGNKIELIEELKGLHDMIFLRELFGSNENSNLSSLMVSKYNKHKKDLKLLKQLLKYDKKIYKKMFKDRNINTEKEELCIYRKYINNKINYNEFKKELVESIENITKYNIEENLRKEYLYQQEEIAEGTFLPRITDIDNGKYPYQLNKEELIKIIENQGKYYPFLLEKINNKYKLIKLLEFKIPYYIGPLNTTTNKKGIVNKNAWIIKKENGIKITPYNFDEVVDKESSAEKFITRMISNCTYLIKEPALPNNSILYSKYKVKNEIKQIKINGQKMTNEFQHKLYKELFLNNTGIITENKFINYLKSTDEYHMYNNLSIEGYSSNKKFANNMQPYIDFFGDEGIFKGNNYRIENAEEIIKWITIFEDKEILENKIRKNYNNLSDEAIKLAISKKYKGWGKLSKKLLTEIYYKDRVTGVNKSIMDLLDTTTENFMQIINNKKYKFQKEIDKLNKVENINKINYSVVEELVTSPSTKKGIYQALKIVEEIVDYMGYNPKSIIIEMARGENNVKTRTDSKKEHINKLYTNHKEEINNYEHLRKELNTLDKIDNQKLFLYFIQEGKSLYSGQTLNLEDLEKYEIDHIIPRTLIKDDSIDNKALVLREENQNKAASFVIPANYRTHDRITWWHHLKKCNLISNKKFNNLCRNYYSEKDIEGFINRQLVETRQITKHVANILNNYYKDTKVMYLHADLLSNYREKHELFKFRELNDYHHAHDAYLTAVLGEYKETYLNSSIDFDKLREISKKLYKEGNTENFKYGYVINSINNEVVLYDEDTGEIKFNADKFNQTIKNTLYQNDILISRKTEIKTKEFYDQTLYKKNSLKAKYPIKKGLDVRLYGGYNNYNYSYMKLIQYIKNNKKKNILVGIPILLEKNKDKEKLIDDYIKQNIKNYYYIVKKDKIPFNSEILYKNQLCTITGCSVGNAEIVNATEFKLTKTEQDKYKYLLNFIFNKKYPSKTNKEINDEESMSFLIKTFDKEINDLFDIIVDKIKIKYPLYNTFYQKLLLVKESKEFYELPFTISFEEERKGNISKVTVIKEILKLLKCNPSNANLVALNKTTKFSSRIGRSNGVNITSATIINKSVTGIRKKEYKF